MSIDDIARVLDEIGHMLEYLGDNPFKVRAYRAAARTLRETEEDVEALIAEGNIRSLPGIGDAIATKIDRLLESGSLPLYDDLRATVPPGILDLLSIPGLGPRKVRLIHRELGVTSSAALERAARSGRLAEVPGFGSRTIENLLKTLQSLEPGGPRGVEGGG